MFAKNPVAVHALVSEIDMESGAKMISKNGKVGNPQYMFFFLQSLVIYMPTSIQASPELLESGVM